MDRRGGEGQRGAEVGLVFRAQTALGITLRAREEESPLANTGAAVDIDAVIAKVPVVMQSFVGCNMAA